MGHTKGKWYANDEGLQGLIYNEYTGKNIAVSYDPKHANLIATAPELLEALKMARNEMAEQGLKHYSLVGFIDNLIARAEGRD